MRDCFAIIKSRYITEKASVLAGLHQSDRNPCLKACDEPKAVFLVDDQATKPEIARALEEIYREQAIKVVRVNTLRVKPKRTNRGKGRGRPGAHAGFKKAIVTFRAGDSIEKVG